MEIKSNITRLLEANIDTFTEHVKQKNDKMWISVQEDYITTDKDEEIPCVSFKISDWWLDDNDGQIWIDLSPKEAIQFAKGILAIAEGIK